MFRCSSVSGSQGAEKPRPPFPRPLASAHSGGHTDAPKPPERLCGYWVTKLSDWCCMTSTFSNYVLATDQELNKTIEATDA